MARSASAPRPEPLGLAEAEQVRRIPLPVGFKPPSQPDPVLQRGAVSAPQITAPTMLNNFDGIGQGIFGTQIQVAPPDTNGAVGLTQYVQWVNDSFAIFDKATGNILPNFPVAGKTLWAGFGGPCETDNDGDPIVIYDKLHDRWVFGQFAVRSSSGGFLINTLQCVAVSTTSDATGTYNRYSFQYNNEFNDYPKMAVWPDAYYATFNMFNISTESFLGSDACAYDGAAMRSGQPATQICFQQASSVGGLLPSDVDGRIPPPPGSPNFMVEFDVNSLNLYKFHVDFATPGNSTFSPAVNIPVAPFTPLCNGDRNCVPQPIAGTNLDSLADRLMYRLAYRNFGDHESLVVNHSVAVGATAFSGAGVRWYELQNPNGAVIVAQQGTFAPDANYRWMGSIAMDISGDIALGYSVSSNTVSPSVAVAGQISSDPRGALENEISIVGGTGSQTGGLTRWGDYSAMQVDPVDDCTFWFTTEYLKNTGSFNWNTRIASFKFPFCGQPDLAISATHSGDFTQGDTNQTYSLTVTNFGGKDSDGTTVAVTDTLQTGVTPTAISGSGWSCTLGNLTCTRSDVLAPRASYPVITLTVDVAANAPGLVTNTATVSGGGEKNTANDTASDQTTIIQTGPDPSITKTHTGLFIQGQTGTYTITVTNAGLSPTDGTTVTVTDNLPAGFTFNAASGTGWICNASSPVTCSRNDALASNSSYPAITVTVNIALNAASRIANTATVSGGGDTNPLNNSASDQTAVIPPPPDLTITKTHTGNFSQGQQLVSYTITVTNVGSTPTTGTVTVTDTLPTGLSFFFAQSLNWSCGFNSVTITCTRSDALAPNASYPPLVLFMGVAGDAPASVVNTATVSGGGEINTSNDTANDPTTINPSPDLTIKSTHTPDPFVAGSTGAYTLTVNNIGHASTSGIVSVFDGLPNGLMATAISGAGWSCSPPPTVGVNCSRSDALAAGSSYPPLIVTVSVNSVGLSSVLNFAQVSGGGELNTFNDTTTDVTNVIGPTLTITKSHTGNFAVGQPGAYTITVGNRGQIATIGTPVMVGDFLPQGLSATAVGGTGWSCSGTTQVSCTRSDALSPANSYPPITVTVNVDPVTASGLAVNRATVVGGGDSNGTLAMDFTNIVLPDLAITSSHVGDFSTGQTGAAYTITLTNVGTIATAGGTVTVSDILPFGMTATAASGTGWSCTVSGTSANCTRPAGLLAPTSSYPAITLTANVGTSFVGSLSNIVSVTGIADGNFGNNSFSDLTKIIGISITPTQGTSATVTAGSSANYGFSVGLPANAGTVSFSATGLPTNSKVSFGPPSLTQSGPVTMTVDTSGNGHVAGLSPGLFDRFRSDFAALLAVLAFLTIQMNRKAKRSWLRLGALGFVLLALASFTACGGGGGGGGITTPPPSTVTPAGTYTITMTATSSNAAVSPTTQSTTITVK